jgi:hypothetical protein
MSHGANSSTPGSRSGTPTRTIRTLHVASMSAPTADMPISPTVAAAPSGDLRKAVQRHQLELDRKSKPDPEADKKKQAEQQAALQARIDAERFEAATARVNHVAVAATSNSTVTTALATASSAITLLSLPQNSSQLGDVGSPRSITGIGQMVSPPADGSKAAALLGVNATTGPTGGAQTGAKRNNFVGGGSAAKPTTSPTSTKCRCC